MNAGYYRFPTIHGEDIVFVCEDDLWHVPASGGTARRLTAGRGRATHPALSPEGALLAFTGREDGPEEVYVMPAAGGEPRRLTFQGANAAVIGWSPDGSDVLFASYAGQPFQRTCRLFAVNATRKELPRELPVGPVSWISYGPRGAVVLARNGGDPARWKRYRGGTAGEIWIDPRGTGRFRRLVELSGNLANPMWLGNRVFFLSDHEGIGNLYSCRSSGRDLCRHTDSQEFYVRNPSTDGRRIVFHAGGDLYLCDPATDTTRRVEVRLSSSRAHLVRKFVDPARYLDGYDVHPAGHSLVLTARGKAFSLGLWEGAVKQHGRENGVRYRFPRWLPDGDRLVVVSDATGEPRLEVYPRKAVEPELSLNELDIGEPTHVAVSPAKDLAALTNHRCELLLVDLKRSKLTVLDSSPHGRLSGPAWSPDGQWLAYSFPDTPETSCLKVCHVKTRKTHPLTKAVLHDRSPVFDPDGKYLYFLGQRELDPVYDALHFDLNFPKGLRPYLLTLRQDAPSPFRPEPRAPGGPTEDNDRKDPADSTAARKPGKQAPPSTVIDLQGSERRVVPFPVPLGRYEQLAGLPNGKVLWTVFPVEGTLGRSWADDNGGNKGTLELWDFAKQEKETLVTDLGGFRLSADGKTMVYHSGRRVRALKAGVKPDEKVATDPPGRKSGWIDLGRCRVAVDPRAEWRQMYREAWRLQREHFWNETMSQVDWKRVYDRYLPLLDRVGSRAEFSDLMWEMQGELGTSHAYEMGGDYRPGPQYRQGFLGADLVYDETTGGYRVEHVVSGDSWDEKTDSPLNAPGVQVAPGDILVAVGGRRLSAERTPPELLVNQAGVEIELTVRPAGSTEERTVTVRTLTEETTARYREWVESNRRIVHEATNGRVGYVHIPDMGPRGYAEFHRSFLAECHRDALLVDVRYNGGGHVSQLLLEKLARKTIGYDLPRWGPPQPYPAYSIRGAVVALTNEVAGSDGDIFCHCFKLMKLGPLIGKRTWGGVIGISPSQRFVDGGLVTQPEYSYWFIDVGWGVENYGTDPDIEVDIKPQDYAAGKDPQLERAIRELECRLRKHPPKLPGFDSRPDLSLPALPPRTDGRCAGSR